MNEITLKWLPDYQYSTMHSIIVRASKKTCYESVKAYDMNSSFLVKSLFFLRGLNYSPMPIGKVPEGLEFISLEEHPYDSFLYGSVHDGKMRRPATKDEFLFSGPRVTLKFTWYFGFESIGDNLTLVRTITCVHAVNKAARRKFSVYWFFIKPFSGFIRKNILSNVKRRAEGAGK